MITATNGFTSGGTLVSTMTLETPLAGTAIAGPKPASTQTPAVNLAAPPSPAAEGLSLAVAMIFAFIGGIVLNLMPCVFPVLSLKALSLTKPGHGNRHHLRIEGMSFGAGVIGTFVALAACCSCFARRASNSDGVSIAVAGSRHRARGPVFHSRAEPVGRVRVHDAGPILAAVGRPATSTSMPRFPAFSRRHRVPCTAPFMGAALGFALAQPALLTLLVFAAGPRHGCPFVPHLVSRLAAVLPKPGAWMER